MTRTPRFWIGLTALAFLLVAAASRDFLAAQTTGQFHTNGFAGKQVAWVRGDDTVRAEEKAHAISEDQARSGTTSEHIQVVTQAGTREQTYAYYVYACPPAPINDDFLAEVYVKADRKGVSLLARVVFPRERDAKRPDEPLSILVEGGTTRFARKWEQLEIRKPTDALKAAVQKLRLQLGRDIDASGAYVDRLVLDVFAGGGGDRPVRR